MTLTIAPPPDYDLATKSSAYVMPASTMTVHAVDVPGEDADEPMDYTPLPAGSVAGPAFPEEAWAEDGNGPMGF